MVWGTVSGVCMDSVKDILMDFLKEVAEAINGEPEPDWKQIWFKRSTEKRLWVFNSGRTAPVFLYMEAKWSPSEWVGKIEANILPDYSVFLWEPMPKEWHLFTEVMSCDSYPEVIEAAQAMWAGAFDKFLDMTRPDKVELAQIPQN